MLVSYDGTDFCGWQIQNGERTVQAELEKGVSAVVGAPVSVTGSGRTDSGVHATGQMVHFDTENLSVPAEKFREAVNTRLPRDIRILKSAETAPDFHSRYHARARIYRYYLLSGESLPAYWDRYCWLVREPLSLPELNRLAAPLTGVHDYTTFSAAGDQSKSKIREVFSARFLTEGPFTVFEIKGNAFLWRMVRSLVGTLIEYRRQGLTPADIKRALDSMDRDAAGSTAPARGLFLHRVIYETEKTLY
jgi:tRNA pseudouridine38-40 synthase